MPDIRLLWSHPHGATNGKPSRPRGRPIVVLVLGLSPRLEGEEMQVPVEGFRGGDRIVWACRRVQQELMEEVAALGKPVVLVLLNGSARGRQLGA